MPRYLIDANLPRWFSLWSGDAYEFVHDKGEGLSDTDVWMLARTQGMTIVSKDADFSARAMLEADGPRVIHIRVGNMRMREFHAFLSREWPQVCQMSAGARLVQVYTDRIESID